MQESGEESFWKVSGTFPLFLAAFEPTGLEIVL